MTKKKVDIQALSTKLKDKQADRFLILKQVTLEKVKADPPHFLKFLLASRTNGTFGVADTQAATSQNQKSRFILTLQNSIN